MIEPIIVTIEDIENPLIVDIENQESLAVNLSEVEYIEILPNPIDLVDYENSVHKDEYYFIKG
jgi:hypothetical protein